jgi:hypothetical protein
MTSLRGIPIKYKMNIYTKPEWGIEAIKTCNVLNKILTINVRLNIL